jgi:hypothetical protein
MPRIITEQEEQYIREQFHKVICALEERNVYMAKMRDEAHHLLKQWAEANTMLQQKVNEQAKYIKDLEDSLAEAYLMSRE